MKMLTSVSAETINNLSPDAGVVMLDVSLDDVDTVQELMTLIDTTRSDPEKWVGVTKGGVKVNEGRKTWSPSYDYDRIPVIGDKYPDKYEPKISFTLVEMTPQNVVAASGAADTYKSGNKDVIQPRAYYNRTDYREKLLFVTMKGPEGLFVVEADNVLCTKGLDHSSDDKNIGQLAVEFSPHKADFSDLSTLPMRYYFVPATAAE